MEKKSPAFGVRRHLISPALVVLLALHLFGGCEKEAGGKPPQPESSTAETGPGNSSLLNKAEQIKLLKIARLAVETFLTTGKIPVVSDPSPALRQPLGAFVTLKRNGHLRGCIGRFEPDKPLCDVVTEMAVAAATQDTRFTPVRPEELPQIRYEISVLSPLRKILNADGIVAGTHGVQVKKGFRGGVFLPQVATEHQLNKEEFLNLLCAEKAGLSRDCWKDPSVELYVFTAQVFDEEELTNDQNIGEAQK